MISQPAGATEFGVLLDAVGTLITPNPPVAQVYSAAAARQGVAIDPAELRHRFRQSFAQDERDELRGPLSTSEEIERRRWMRIVHQCLPEVPNPERAFSELWNHFANAGSWAVFPDAAKLLIKLIDQNVAFAIASNFDARLRGVLIGLGFGELARNRLLISSEILWRKPHARFYAAGCSLLGLSARQVTYVGDDPTNDLEGPRRAGLRAILIDRTGNSGESGPWVIRTLGAIPALLGTLPGHASEGCEELSDRVE